MIQNNPNPHSPAPVINPVVIVPQDKTLRPVSVLIPNKDYSQPPPVVVIPQQVTSPTQPPTPQTLPSSLSGSGPQFCKNCKSQIAPGKRFCTDCGTKVEGGPAVSVLGPTNPNPNPSGGTVVSSLGPTREAGTVVSVLGPSKEPTGVVISSVLAPQKRPSEDASHLTVLGPTIIRSTDSPPPTSPVPTRAIDSPPPPSVASPHIPPGPTRVTDSPTPLVVKPQPAATAPPPERPAFTRPHTVVLDGKDVSSSFSIQSLANSIKPENAEPAQKIPITRVPREISPPPTRNSDTSPPPSKPSTLEGPAVPFSLGLPSGPLNKNLPDVPPGQDPVPFSLGLPAAPKSPGDMARVQSMRINPSSTSGDEDVQDHAYLQRKARQLSFCVDAVEQASKNVAASPSPVRVDQKISPRNPTSLPVLEEDPSFVEIPLPSDIFDTIVSRPMTLSGDELRNDAAPPNETRTATAQEPSGGPGQSGKHAHSGKQIGISLNSIKSLNLKRPSGTKDTKYRESKVLGQGDFSGGTGPGGDKDRNRTASLGEPAEPKDKAKDALKDQDRNRTQSLPSGTPFSLPPVRNFL